MAEVTSTSDWKKTQLTNLRMQRPILHQKMTVLFFCSLFAEWCVHAIYVYSIAQINRIQQGTKKYMIKKIPTHKQNIAYKQVNVGHKCW